jgi:hypothetical protein
VRVAREEVIRAKPGFRAYQVLQERLKPGGVLSKQDTAWDLGIADIVGSSKRERGLDVVGYGSLFVNN